MRNLSSSSSRSKTIQPLKIFPWIRSLHIKSRPSVNILKQLQTIFTVRFSPSSGLPSAPPGTDEEGLPALAPDVQLAASVELHAAAQGPVLDKPDVSRDHVVHSLYLTKVIKYFFGSHLNMWPYPGEDALWLERVLGYGEILLWLARAPLAQLVTLTIL